MRTSTPTRLTITLSLLFALLLAGCGSAQPSGGDGWEFLGKHQTPFWVPEGAQLFSTVDELEAAVEIIIDEPDMDDFMLLVFSDNTGWNGCGYRVYDDLTQTATGLRFTTSYAESADTCTLEDISGAAVFAVSESLLPENADEITIDPDWTVWVDREVQPAPQITIEVPPSS